jgi:hypothetical protein
MMRMERRNKMSGIFNGDLYSNFYNGLSDRTLFPKYKYVRNRPDLMPKTEQPRNEKCKCGSGLKYKHCCGKRI